MTLNLTFKTKIQLKKKNAGVILSSPRKWTCECNKSWYRKCFSLIDKEEMVLRFSILNNFTNIITGLQQSTIASSFFQIKFLKSKEGCAMIQMSDAVAVERCIRNLHNVNLHGREMQLGYVYNTVVFSAIKYSTPSFFQLRNFKFLVVDSETWTFFGRLHLFNENFSFIPTIKRINGTYSWHNIFSGRGFNLLVKWIKSLQKVYHERSMPQK